MKYIVCTSACPGNGQVLYLEECVKLIIGWNIRKYSVSFLFIYFLFNMFCDLYILCCYIAVVKEMFILSEASAGEIQVGTTR